MPSFHITQTRNNKFRWYFTGAAGTKLANSGQNYESKAEARQDIEAVQSAAVEAQVVDLQTRRAIPQNVARFELYRDRSRKFRWRLRSLSGEIIAVSSPLYTQKQDAEAAIQFLQDNAAGADLIDETITTGEDDSTTVGTTPNGEDTHDDPPYDLGELPADLRIQWPHSPIIHSEETTRLSDGMLNISEGNKRHFVTVNLDRINVAASNVDIQVQDGIIVGQVIVSKACQRIRIRGGNYHSIVLEMPEEGGVYAANLFVEDVLIDGVKIETIPEENYALRLRGRRIAVINSHIHARDYCIWLAESGRLNSEDFILAKNLLESDGPQATVRIINCIRSVVVDNRMTNGEKHNYRLHGCIDLAFAARNILRNTGVMISSMRRDDYIRSHTPPDEARDDHAKKVWFQNNEIYYNVIHGPFQIRKEFIKCLVATGNTVFSNTDPSVLNDPAGLGKLPDCWDISENTLKQYP